MSKSHIYSFYIYHPDELNMMAELAEVQFEKGNFANLIEMKESRDVREVPAREGARAWP